MRDRNHDDKQDGPAMLVPEVPNLRTFRVSFDGLESYTTVLAHEVEINQMGNVLRFREYTIHPTEGPTNRVVRCILKPQDGWLEYEEIIPEPRPSLVDVNGNMLG